jgi:Amiloride-sensitive sodium channel
MTQKRQERYGNIDFIANCGGLMGLCLGVSVLSFIEIVYFCTIRLWFHKQGSTVIIIVDEFQENLPGTHSYRKMAKAFIIDYCNKTTIAGVKYLVESSLMLIERIWWALVILISLFACGSLIFNVLRRYEQSPVIISYANEETSISQVVKTASSN